MKVRHRTLNVELEVEERPCFTLHEGGPYFVSKQGSYLAKAEWTLCDPPERWIDVTERFTHYTDDAFIERNPSQMIIKVYGGQGVDANGYRLRKVQGTLWKYDDRANPVGWAFIIEKREP